MRTVRWMAVVVGLMAASLSGSPQPAAADVPQNGFGLAGGLAVHRNKLTYQGGTTTLYTSAGLSVTGDAQFVINERWSLDPYLLLSLERTSRHVTGTISNGAAGLETRRWIGGGFLGVRLGYYVQLLHTTSSTSTYYGPGLGLSLGAEDAGGFTWGAILDVMRVGPDADAHAGLRLHIGWRWY